MPPLLSMTLSTLGTVHGNTVHETSRVRWREPSCVRLLEHLASCILHLLCAFYCLHVVCGVWCVLRAACCVVRCVVTCVCLCVVTCVCLCLQRAGGRGAGDVRVHHEARDAVHVH